MSIIQLTEDVWTELSAGPCTVNALLGHAWIRCEDAAPAYAPTVIDGKEYDGDLIGYRGTNYTAVQNNTEKKTFGRARTSDPVAVNVTEA